MQAKPYLISATLRRDEIEKPGEYPFNISVLKNFEMLEFHPDVTFLVGENGTGKSTLIEALAVACGFGTQGGTRNVNFETAETRSPLAGCLKLVRSYKAPRDHYFLRAESFYNVASYMDEVGYLQSYGGKSLHAQSHGEAFMAVLTNKLRGNGLYIFDEPEAALSPTRQMAALAAIHRLVLAESQFIIATHSPILMAYPRAKILLLDENGMRPVAYEETEHFKVTRDFIHHRAAMLDVLMEED